MAAAFHFAAFTDTERAAGSVAAHAFNHSAEAMLEACGFNWVGRTQRYHGTAAQLARMNRLIDAGFIACRGNGVWRADVGHHAIEPLAADKLIAAPARCRRTLELF